MSWREERRQDRAAEAEQARADAVAAAEIAAIRERTRAEVGQAAAAQREHLRREVEDAARKRRTHLLYVVRAWLADHVVDLLIYPLAVVSAVMAVPAMSEFGHDVYGTAAGYALPVITELGMWAFAVAVQHTHRRHPDRPVWALRLGVWSFATVAAVLNALHGLDRGLDAGVVMAVASVAGVVAHQLVAAAPRRSRVERDAARMAGREARKVTAARSAAVRAATAEIDDDGSARLVYTPGRYRLHTRWLGRDRLTTLAVPGRPVLPVLDSTWDALDRELADMLADSDRLSDRGPVGTLDRGAQEPHDQAVEQDESTRRPARRPRKGRSIDELRIELRKRIEADPGSIDPTSAESIRRALRCSPARARQLRDEKEV